MRTTFWSFVTCAAFVVGGLFVTAASRADDQSANKSQGKISGVVTSDGKPLANARVAVLPAHVKGKRAKAGGNGDVKRSNDDASAPATQPSESGKHRLRDAANQARTDADGKFTIDGLAPGEYVVVAGGKGLGKARQRVSVAANQDTTVELSVQGGKGADDGGPSTRPTKVHNRFHKLGV